VTLVAETPNKFPPMKRDSESQSRDPRGRWRAFTLIELLVVIAIIAILASMTNFADSSTKDYGGWDTPAANVYKPYMWLANFPGMTFPSISGSTDPKATDREPAWPRSTDECHATRAFITHRVSDTPGSVTWDVGHLGKFNAPNVRHLFLEFSLAPDQPVGQADGSTVVRPKMQIRKRAVGGPGGNTAYYY